MAIETKYKFFTNTIKTALETLITGADSDLIVTTGNDYATNRNNKKIGYALGDRIPKTTFQSADRSKYNESDSAQNFIIIVHEELNKDVDIMDDIEERLGYWMSKLDNLILNLGVHTGFEEKVNGTAVNHVQIISTEPDNVLTYGIEQGDNQSPEIGIVYNCKFYYDQINY